MKIFCLLIVLLTLNTWAQDYNPAITKARFLIEQHKKQTNIPGVQIAVMIDGVLVWSESFGYKDLEHKIAVSKNTKFRIASVSKPLTSVALGKMLETGTLKLDDSIHKLVPEFPQKEFIVTPRQLASSTSGIRHYTSQKETMTTTNYASLIEALAPFKNDDLLFKPGSSFEYSSYGWVVLGAAMEKASQHDFKEIMQNIWNDLEMNNTSFDIPNNADTTLSKFYIKNKNHRIEAPFMNRSFIYPGGGYLSTAEDLAHFGNSLLSNNYLKNKTKELLFSKTKLNNGKEIPYGLGWEVGQSRLQTAIVYHSGSMSTARSHLMLYPNEKIVLAYLANTGDEVFFNDREAQSIAELFVNSKRNTKTDYAMLNAITLVGKWDIRTTSLRNKKSKGVMELYKNQNGSIEGFIEFTRSRRKKKFPILLAESTDNKIHLIAVSPMFIDFYIELTDNHFTGQWLHDFNVNGTPEDDPYWLPRSIEGTKSSH
ncbi:serine hydrolase domain-containing protein [Aquimarina brevivitae]|uniref:CubicO group peptidase (Beta-lactamase class C family) n=1 Tax=Aquimarina brevivitae TaxID=323412 RepID=A0A4Q7NYU7_9FLAO|nr:serine hydrolase domain-containing protein [Aquimarina brevivitae]RZS92464.1 CubicO group peptidase (beta-lactamase class C family) [Aquimarina brevivitae]